MEGAFEFHNTGEFRASGGATFGGNITVSWGGRSAIFHENGDVTGPIWGETLYNYLHNSFSKKVNDYGEIGSYLLAWCATENIGPNGQVPGEHLRASTAYGYVEDDGLPGMWRCMSYEHKL